MVFWRCDSHSSFGQSSSRTSSSHLQNTIIFENGLFFILYLIHNSPLPLWHINKIITKSNVRSTSPYDKIKKVLIVLHNKLCPKNSPNNINHNIHNVLININNSNVAYTRPRAETLSAMSHDPGREWFRVQMCSWHKYHKFKHGLHPAKSRDFECNVSWPWTRVIQGPNVLINIKNSNVKK